MSLVSGKQHSYHPGCRHCHGGELHHLYESVAKKDTRILSRSIMGCKGYGRNDEKALLRHGNSKTGPIHHPSLQNCTIFWESMGGMFPEHKIPPHLYLFLISRPLSGARKILMNPRAMPLLRIPTSTSSSRPRPSPQPNEKTARLAFRHLLSGSKIYAALYLASVQLLDGDKHSQTRPGARGT